MNTEMCMTVITLFHRQFFFCYLILKTQLYCCFGASRQGTGKMWRLSNLLSNNTLMKAANYGELKAFSRMEERRNIM